MAGHKRARADSTSAPKSKKLKSDNVDHAGLSRPESSLVSGEVDFPRGGGTTFTPLEVKSIRTEAVKEANEELFKVSFVSVDDFTVFIMGQDREDNTKRLKKRKRKSEIAQDSKPAEKKQSETIRIEHLNYKVSTTLESVALRANNRVAHCTWHEDSGRDRPH